VLGVRGFIIMQITVVNATDERHHKGAVEIVRTRTCCDVTDAIFYIFSIFFSKSLLVLRIRTSRTQRNALTTGNIFDFLSLSPSLSHLPPSPISLSASPDVVVVVFCAYFDRGFFDLIPVCPRSLLL